MRISIMRHVLLCLLLLAPGLAVAEGELHPLLTGDEARGWEGVGRLDIDGKGFCTATLIAPDLVLTAAHCLFDRDSGAQIAPERIRFLAGWRNGRAAAYREVRHAVADPDYVYSGEDELARVGHDLALLQLDQPILLPQLAPFAIGSRPSRGSAVSVVSYAKDRAAMPSIEEGCGVIASDGSALILTCDIDFGSSGAPVFALRDGVAELVSVISAKAELDGEKVALAVPVDRPLAALRIELAGDRPGAGRGSGGAGAFGRRWCQRGQVRLARRAALTMRAAPGGLDLVAGAVAGTGAGVAGPVLGPVLGSVLTRAAGRKACKDIQGH
jgi:protease YdgD